MAEHTLEELKRLAQPALQNPRFVARIAVAALGSPTRANKVVLSSIGDEELTRAWRWLLVLARDSEKKHGVRFEEVLSSMLYLEESGEKQEEQKMTTARMKAYVLYPTVEPGTNYVLVDDKPGHVVVVARSPREAASILGGEYIEPEGGRKTVVEGLGNGYELSFVGIVRFASELFRKMDETDRALAHSGGCGVYERGSLSLLLHGKAVELKMYEHFIMFPDYIIFRGYDT